MNETDDPNKRLFLDIFLISALEPLAPSHHQPFRQHTGIFDYSDANQTTTLARW